jgi:hypothetical protein
MNSEQSPREIRRRVSIAKFGRKTVIAMQELRPKRRNRCRDEGLGLASEPNMPYNLLEEVANAALTV